MDVRELKVEGALEFTPRVFPDERGAFLSPFQEAAFVRATGAPLFPVAQTNHSVSRRGVVRGVHYTVTPPGVAKYVYCPRGEALDIVVDLREGSPTFGAWDVVRMDQSAFRAMYFPVGVGHAFVALADDTVMSYMLSGSYVPENELALSAMDPELGLPIPADVEPLLSARDQVAPTLAEARAQGSLPDYAESRRLDQHLGQRDGRPLARKDGHR
ncbi:dTDP-4-dehydrorhamnose 3,5-epimerase family protein [Streptomyces profundus]|uniref:dTDP-4-dehydrorhamnose 3,5-epimerase family protein n=1 Tax=Streptomyces profundus TaxID=2867410 RepID=UPI001D1683F1|nr:dTDP-4-dehydrorhamnose 3,5-epimerase [Streptomyces sp. MA3_2.13]UED83235.1 dTDP-4-dehydrorhamnose 3,5-epimerase [Streptomyces sp. MA3_2.13]